MALQHPVGSCMPPPLNIFINYVHAPTNMRQQIGMSKIFFASLPVKVFYAGTTGGTGRKRIILCG